MVDPASGRLAPGVAPSVTRQLVLFEFEAHTVPPVSRSMISSTTRSGGASAIGRARSPIFRCRDPGRTCSASASGLTELPRVGSTEVWEFLDLTDDAHPMHLHLVQFQLINRQAVKVDPKTGRPPYLAA